MGKPGRPLPDPHNRYNAHFLCNLDGRSAEITTTQPPWHLSGNSPKGFDGRLRASTRAAPYGSGMTVRLVGAICIHGRKANDNRPVGGQHGARPWPNIPSLPITVRGIRSVAPQIRIPGTARND